MIGKLLIANRGEIARRIARTCRRMGIATVAATSQADRFTAPVLEADEHVVIGPATAAESYLNVAAVVDACRRTGADAVHPGYGFLSENAEFAEALAAVGIRFVGPSPEHIRLFGLKHTAREIARQAGVPLLAGSGLLRDADEALVAAEAIGFPVMLKSTAGGGGIGMRLCRDAAELASGFDAVRRAAEASFGDTRVYLERFVARARHVEVQIFGDGRGRVAALGERDCSLQRRHQKVVEETPAPNLAPALREALHAAAVRLAERVLYANAGTVEFVVDADRGDFAFLEVNTRLQVEHPVTEAVTGIDLVEWMIRQAGGEDVLAAPRPPPPGGAAIEVRLYAEDPAANFRPSAGRLTEVRYPEGVRVDGWIASGAEVTSFYDPMLAKIVAHGPTREAAAAKLEAALGETRVAGIANNLAYLRAIVASDVFRRGEATTASLAALRFASRTIEVIEPGAQSTLQELPGRLGLWAVGVPPSGPMDACSFRIANRIVGNPETAPVLELTATGPALLFRTEATVGLAGARMAASLDGRAVPYGVPVRVAAGEVLRLGAVEGPGQRTYLAVRGTFEAPEVLGSRAAFVLGGFGGHATGALRTGDVLHVGDVPPTGEPATQPLPPLSRDWTLDVVYGPHGAPDFFTDADVEALFSEPYEVHFNSARTGVRLVGPKPAWARADGGEAGLHPSNLHDNPYAVGAIDFTGDTPIILGPDGPSLGGFACPAVIAEADLWKLGQLKPGDAVRFRPVARPADPVAGPVVARRPNAGSAVLARSDATHVPVVYRRQGDRNLLVEFGDMRLDLGLRLRAHAMMEGVRGAGLPGIVDLTPGIRSLQIHYDPDRLSRTRLLGALAEIEAALPDSDDIRVPSRTVHLPLSWNDGEVRLAMRKYQELVRPNAPWCPDNIEFIRRINGLPDAEAVQRTVLDAEYLVLGLGDVYLGAPVATPLDPRHRLVTTKYNPARTWTPENAVGIGGAYLCIYGMEGPGGYQLFGRTIQMWNTWRTTREFEPGHPWLLRFFDRIRFHLVDERELAEAREAFPHGRYPIRIEDGMFDHGEHRRMLAREAQRIDAAKRRQQDAFDAERARWKSEGLDGFVQEGAVAGTDTAEVPEGCVAARAPVPGNVWQVRAAEGSEVEVGAVLAVLESMKMEFSVSAPGRGRVREIRCRPGRQVRAGDVIAVLEPI